MVKNKRSINGNGTLRLRKNGSFEYRIVFEDEFGERQRKSFYGKNDIECYEKAEFFLKNLEKKKLGIDVDATIPKLLKDKYDVDLKMNYVKEQGYTRNLYTLSIIEKSIIGNIKIVDLTKHEIEIFLITLTRYANNTIVKVYRQIKLAFKIAYNKGIIPKNLIEAEDIRCPKSSKKDKKVVGLTVEEQTRLVEYLMNYKAPKGRNVYVEQIFIALYSGLRMGEINALKIENIDLKNNIIIVKNTVSRDSNYHSFISETPKTKAGVRDVPIVKELKPILEQAIKNYTENPYGLLFYDNIGNKIISTNQVNCFFKRVCEKCNIEVRGQHSLRHTFATRCIEAGISPLVLKNWMGHTDIHITLDTYANVFDKLNMKSVSMLNNYYDELSMA